MTRTINTSVTIKESGYIGRFSMKVTGDVTSILGITAHASLHDDTLSLAEICVMFNSGADGPIQFDLVQPDPASQKNRSLDSLSLSQPIKQNAPIEGYVKDLGNASAYPYTVTIYFQVND